ncbi:microtubule-associated protein 1B-like [Argopecten irradians]|uniref:microtubule-associated protein 1B-like n=1 Tax=Argopecten irradians TaxID=31199 RepID=UPI00371E3037
MRGKLLLAGGKPIAWNHNTSYVGVSGVHSENSPPSIGRRRKEDREFKEILGAIENMHRKDMQSFTTNRKHLEKSMLAYSERMREINKGRRSLPVIITPASGEKPVLPPPKKFSNIVRPDVASPSSDLLGSSREESLLSANHLHSPLNSPRKLSPISISRNRNRKMTFHGSEIERHLLSPNMHTMRHSISGTGTNHPTLPSEGTLRTRKISTISPPDLFDISRARDARSIDSAYESFNGSEMEYDQRDKHSQNDEMDVDVHSISSVKIACFPDINEERKHINNMFGVPEEVTDDVSNQRKTKKRKTLKKSPAEAKAKKNKYLKRFRKNDKKEKKEEIAETIIETYVDEDEKEEEEEIEEEPEKKKREVCFGFRYSVAIKELLKKPNPFNVSKKDMVSKVEMENGRIINTLGPAVLKVVDVDRLNNIRGVPLNIKRDDPMSKRKKAAANLSRSVSRNPLPSISRGVSVDGNREDNDRVMDLSERSRSKTSLYDKPIVSSQQSPSTVMVIGADD